MLEEIKNNIYDARTREYFKEIESSVYDGNYRSAVVMLYSVVIADLLYKLEELSDVYQETVPTEILANIQKVQNDNRSSSEWEMQLVNDIYKKTKLIDTSTLAEIEYLKKMRNLSAHPAFTENNELILPNRETVVGLIKGISSQVLTKPPVFAGKVTELILDDLVDKELFFVDEDDLEKYIINKYFKRITESMKLKIFKDFWKLTFCLDNNDCNAHRNINYRFLKIVIKNTKLKCLDYIRNNESYFNQLTNNADINEYLIRLLYYYPELYDLLDEPSKTNLEIAYSSKKYLNLISYFKYDNIEEFINSIKSLQLIDVNYIKKFEEYVNKQNKQTKLIDKYIDIVKGACSYNEADRLFSNIILPNIENMNKKQIEELIKTINENDQINGRFRALNDNDIIIHKKAEELGEEFNYDKYPNFKFSREKLDDSFIPF